VLEAELKNTTLATVTKHKKRSKKEDQMKSEKKFLVTGPTGATGGETVERREIVMRILAAQKPISASLRRQFVGGEPS
jgi:hypothetical protein